MKNSARHLAPFLILAAAGLAQAETRYFPPGFFTDGGHYRMSDFAGKTLILVFYEQNCPRCRGELMPAIAKAAAATKGTPVRLIAVGPLASVADCAAYRTTVGLPAPVFADTFGAMEGEFGHNISMNNIIQCEVIGPTGFESFVQDLDEKTIQELAARTKWRYKDDGYDKQLARAVEAFEWNQYEAGMKLLKPFLTSSDKAVKGSANKLLDAIKTEAATWFDEAQKKLDADPVSAYDIDQRLVAMFDPANDLAKKAAAQLVTLKDRKEIKDELEARKLYAQLESAVARATLTQKGEIIAFCKRAADKYPDTPTGKRIAAFGASAAKIKLE